MRLTVMVLRIERSTIWISLALVLVLGLITVRFGSAQQPGTSPPNTGWCIKGHPVEFMVGQTTIYVKTEYIGVLTGGEIANTRGRNCPTGPLKLERVFLSGFLGLLGLDGIIGHPSDRVWVHATVQPRILAEHDHDSGAIAPWIEDLTLQPPHQGFAGPGGRYPTVRVYGLHYQTEDDSAATVEITCGDEAPSRQCVRTGYGYGGLVVGYKVMQTALPIPDQAHATSTVSRQNRARSCNTNYDCGPGFSA
jgi:hypothetical protein